MGIDDLSDTQTFPGNCKARNIRFQHPYPKILTDAARITAMIPKRAPDIIGRTEPPPFSGSFGKRRRKCKKKAIPPQ